MRAEASRTLKNASSVPPPLLPYNHMATSTVLDAIELFNVIGQHYAHPRLDPAAPPLALAGAMQQLFALVEVCRGHTTRRVRD